MFSSLHRQVRCATVLLLCLLTVMNGGIMGADARKELPINTVFPPVVQEALRCDVCSFIVANALNMVEAKRDELKAKRLPLREDAVLEITENMCIPFKDQGEWIRQVGLRVEPKEDDGYAVNVDVSTFYGRCRRTCGTVAALCEQLMDGEAMDDFPAQLLRLSRDAVMSDEAHREDVFETFCATMQQCTRHKRHVAALEKAVKTSPLLRAELQKERPRRMKNEEREMEAMMYRMTREQQQSADVFSRDEVHRMQNAILHGTREDVAAIDPKIFDLSEQEFEELRKHMAGERGLPVHHPPGSEDAYDEDDL